MKRLFTTKGTKKTFHKGHQEKIFVVFVTTFVFFVVSALWPQHKVEAYPFAQPSPRPTIDLTATALAQPTNPPAPTNTPLPPGPTSPPQPTNPPQPTSAQPSITPVPPTATRVRAQATNTHTPTTESPTATQPPTATDTEAPPTEIPSTQTPWVIYITTTPQPGGGSVIIITVVPTLQPTAVQPEIVSPPKANWDWLGWLVLMLVLVLLAVPLMWLARRKFILPMIYPTRGRPRSTGVRPGRGRRL